MEQLAELEVVCSGGRRASVRFECKGERVWAIIWLEPGSGPPSEAERAEVEGKIASMLNANVAGSFVGGPGVAGRARIAEAGRRFLQSGRVPEADEPWTQP